MSKQLTFGSLFSGGGGMDLAFERAGFICKWQVEKDKFARRALERHFPDAKRYEDATHLCYAELESVYAVVGGDPCPIRSKAKLGTHTHEPDLAPYFLETVRQLRPVWVCRENVPAPDANQFVLCLEWLGYAACILKVDSKEVTGQSRAREVIIGVHSDSGYCALEPFSQREGSQWNRKTSEERGAFALCLTKAFRQWSIFNQFVFEPDRGIRILAPVERARLQGFPDDWLNGFSDNQQAKIYGNAVTVDVFQQIAQMIFNYVSL